MLCVTVPQPPAACSTLFQLQPVKRYARHPKTEGDTPGLGATAADDFGKQISSERPPNLKRLSRR